MAAPATARVTYVGLTGGLGSGKSTALEELARLGAATLSADAVVHELLETDELRGAIAAHLGDEVVPDGVVDRPALARRVFSDPQQRSWLEEQLWPRVRARMDSWREQIEAGEDRPGFAVVEVALLFESGLQVRFDHTLTIVADEEIRRARAASRGHELVAERAGLQLSQYEKTQRADFTVRNDGTPAELRAQLSRVLARMEAED